jgi:ParB family chromosome partitioning protein
MIQEKKRVLGRGLESLIPAARTAVATMVTATASAPAADAAPGEQVHEIRLEEIERSPYQPRRGQDEAALEELAQSIRAQGVLQPIVVRYISEIGGRRPAVDGQAVDGLRSTVDGGNGAAEHPPTNTALEGAPDHPHPSNTGLGGAPATSALPASAQPKIKYQLIAGERRWLASKLAGRETVPAIVRQVSNEQAVEMALIENVQREDLDCMEMAFAFDRLGRDFGLTQEEMSKRTGKDRATIGNLLRLLKMPAEVRSALARHELSFGHAKELLGIEDPDVQVTAAQKVMRESLSVRQTELLVNHLIWLASGEKPKKAPPPEDPNVKAARMNLETRLGCRVKILDKQGKGKVVIEYKSLEDFDRIVEALGK